MFPSICHGEFDELRSALFVLFNQDDRTRRGHRVTSMPREYGPVGYGRTGHSVLPFFPPKIDSDDLSPPLSEALVERQVAGFAIDTHQEDTARQRAFAGQDDTVTFGLERYPVRKVLGTEYESIYFARPLRV